jgi:hypothetical protein
MTKQTIRKYHIIQFSLGILIISVTSHLLLNNLSYKHRISPFDINNSSHEVVNQSILFVDYMTNLDKMQFY